MAGYGERARKILGLLAIPSYETKGTTSEEKEVILDPHVQGKIQPTRGIQPIESESESEDKTSESEYIPESSPGSSLGFSPVLQRRMPAPDYIVMKPEQKWKPSLESSPEIQTTFNAVPSHRAKKRKHAPKPRPLQPSPQASSSSFATHPAIDCAKTKKDGNRVRDKRHVCHFCNKEVLHMARHFELCHAQEAEVAKLLAFPKKSMNRKNGFLELIRVGDFYHNCDVIALKHGDLKLVRRPSKIEVIQYSYNDYGPCPCCLGFMLKKHLWHHRKNCEAYKEKEGHGWRQMMSESNSILLGTQMGHHEALPSNFVNSILSNMRNDEAGQYCKEDTVILKYGCLQYEKYGDTQVEFIRQQMRQLARLLVALNENVIGRKSLCDFLTPDKFDDIVKATRTISGRVESSSTKRPEYDAPSLALKIGHALKKCANMERGFALRRKDMKKEKTLVAFITLLDLEWSIKISSNALSTLQNRKLNTGLLVPLTNDLLILNKHIEKELSYCINLLNSKPSASTWKRLCTLTLARLILFNKRRAGEASRMTVEQYNCRPIWSETSADEIKESLSPYEKELSKNLGLVYIIGKRGRKVPVILTTSVKRSIDAMNMHRDQCGIADTNPYIFARGSNFAKGHNCLKKLTEEVVLSKPDLITSTKLRKYVATVCQVFDLTPNQYDWLARHLGHDIRVHREFYRMHDDALELTKVSRLLLAVDQGEAKRFAGKSLEEIQLNDLPDIDVDIIEEEPDDEEQIELEPRNRHLNRSSSEDEDNLYQAPAPRPKPQTTKNKGIKKKYTPKKMWTADEKGVVLSFFRTKIKQGSVPGKKECEECLEKHKKELQGRKWTDVKFCVKNALTKISRIAKK